MASVRLAAYDGEVDDLPEVCMRCGAPSSLRKNKKFSWAPPWVGVLLLAGLIPYLIVASIVTKKCRVAVPLCEQHKNHWLMRQLLVFLSLAALIVFGVLASVLAGVLSEERHGSGENPLFLFVCVGWLGLMVGWIILAAIVQSTTIRPGEITETRIKLVSVSQEFADACEEERPLSRAKLDRAARERWNDGERRPRRRPARPVEEFEEDEKPPRRRPPRDSYREEPS